MKFGKIIQLKEKYVCTKCGKIIWTANTSGDAPSAGESISCPSCHKLYKMVEIDIKPGWSELEMVSAKTIALHGGIIGQ